MICSRAVHSTNVVFLLFILLDQKIVDAVIVQRPSDTIAMVNESTFFNCSTSIRPVDDRSVIWFHFPLDAGGDRKYVYDDGRILTNYRNRFDINKDFSSGTFTLLALRLETKDAGRYECRDDVHADIGASAELTVLGSALVCESDMDPDGVVGPTQCHTPIAPDELQLSCSVKYNGRNVPQMIWRNAEDSSTINKTECVNKDNRVITCNASLTADLQLNRSVYYCEMTTTQNYKYCSLKIPNILYVFSGNATVNITTDEDVKCSANSSQSCSYRWKWFNGSYSLNVSTDQTMKPTRVGSHRCEATCYIGSTPCTVNVTFAEVYSLAVNEEMTASTGQYLWVLLVLLLVIVLIALIIVGLLHWRRKRSSRRDLVSQDNQTIEIEAKPLIAEYGENNEQVKQSHAEPNNELKEEVLSITSDHSSMPLIPVNAEDNKQVKQIHAEPNEDLKEDVPIIRSDQSAMPLIAENGGDNGQVKHSHAEPNKELKEVETNRTDQSTKITEDKDQVKQSRQSITEPDKVSKGLSLLEGKPENVGAIDRKDDKGKRITVSNDKLFVATENSPDLQIYDVTKNCIFIKTARIPGMVNPFDLVCCHATKCLFVSDCKVETDQKEIIRIEPDMTVFKRWSTVKEFGNLSVSNESNIIQCVSNLSRLIECTRDGKFIRAIPLPGLVHPCHAIKLNSGEFVVSHGCKNDALHQVCCVNEDGKVLRSFGGEKGTSLQQLNEPKYLIVEEGNILVLDSSNRRILLLDSDLTVKREFLNKYTGVLSPGKMCLCKATRNLFVVDSEHEVLIISIK